MAIGNSFMKITNEGAYVISGFASSFVLRTVLKLNSDAETIIIVFEVIILWEMIKDVIKNNIFQIWTVKKNENWQRVLESMMHFMSSVLVFLLTQLVLSSLGNAGMRMNMAEMIIGLLIILSIMYSLYHKYEYYSKLEEEVDKKIVQKKKTNSVINI